MITTSVAQYLHPDYLPPLPTTLDAKKSPLALLAQTCSSIGKEPSSAKSIIPPLDKKDGEKSNEKSTTDTKRDQKNKEESSDKPGFRTVSQTHKDIPPLVPVTTSKDEKSSSPSIYKTSPKPKDTSASLGSNLSHTEGNSSFARTIHSRTPGSRHSSGDTDEDRKRPVSSPLSPTKTSRESGYSSDNIRSSISSAYSYNSLSSASSTYPHFTHAGHGLSADALAAAQFPGYPLPLPAHGAFGSSSAAAAALAAQSSALSAQSSALKSAYGSSISPYVTYARVRTPSGATTLVPVCRDPYCTNCQLTLQNSHLSATCTAVGCAQCAHEKTLQNLSLGLQAGSSYSHYPPSLTASSLLSSVPSNLSSYSFSSLYPSSLLSAHTQSGMSFACNWVSPGNEPCGKRFTTSEELLQHLRSHTTPADPISLAMYERYGLPAAGLSGLHGHLPTHGSISPNSLRRNYPTSLSPLGGLMGSSRYHPYKSLLTPTSALSSSQQLPSFGPYLSPYSVYGQRIGAAAVP